MNEMKAIKIFHVCETEGDKEGTSEQRGGLQRPGTRSLPSAPLRSCHLDSFRTATAFPGWWFGLTGYTEHSIRDCCHHPPEFLLSRQWSREELRLPRSPTQSQLGMIGRCHLLSLREPQC